jgi:hypothetical protein
MQMDGQHHTQAALHEDWTPIPTEQTWFGRFGEKMKNYEKD